ncbi:MAG: 4-hydroxy-tetrahydrodipicolinate reductase [Dehalococcoidales bacterium]|nr:4-hydroxy-tetrahydrodipicolinate reductase [Dehalococcoidales bacterium]
MKLITVVVHGVTGKMGREVVSAICREPGIKLVGAVDVDVSRDYLVLPDGSGKVPLSSALEGMLTALKPDVMIDFSVAKAALPAIQIALKKKVYVVSGTTGLTNTDLAKIDKLAKANGVGAIVASNFALSAVVMMHLAGIAARYFDYAEIIELHHNTKADAPSGTAISTAKAMAQAKGKPFNKLPVEKGRTLKSRGEQVRGIPIHSVRLPGLLAHQEVLLGAMGQTLSIRHDTVGRDCYMPGVMLSVKAIVGLKGLTVGLGPILGLEG